MISALVAAPLAIAAIFMLPPLGFAAVFLALAAVALDEWARLAGVYAWIGRMLVIAVFAGVCGVLTVLPGVALPVLALVGVGWVGALAVVLGYPGSGVMVKRPWVMLVSGLVVLVGAWLALVNLRALPAGGWLVLWVFVVVWSADIGAYFAGRAVGRRKLAPQVSPGKTWEGALGGVAAAALFGSALVAASPLGGTRWSWSEWLLLALGLAAVSIVGDLFESVVKRESGAKDSGGLLPGHGGLLDRIDALVAALPTFALFMLLAG